MTVCSDSIEVYLSTREILLRLGEFVTSCWTSETLLSVFFFCLWSVFKYIFFINNFLEYLLSLAHNVTVNTWKSWIRMCAALKSLETLRPKENVRERHSALKLNCLICVKLKKNDCFQTAFPKHNPGLLLVNKQIASPPNSHHWLSQCCHARLAEKGEGMGT